MRWNVVVTRADGTQLELINGSAVSAVAAVTEALEDAGANPDSVGKILITPSR